MNIADATDWTEDLSVNVKLFDAQHRRFLKLIGRLESAMAEGRAWKELAEFLSDLTDYAEEHFATEEAVMKAYDFPWRDTHALEHKRFIEWIAGVRKTAAGDPAISVHVLYEMNDWLHRHVRGTDRMYTEHLNARGFL